MAALQRCLGGEIHPVAVGARITSRIEWDVTNAWWQLSITDGTNTSVETVEAPGDPSGADPTTSWSEFTAIVPGGSFEAWNGVDAGDYPANDWVMTTTFATLPDTPVAASAWQMVSVGRESKPTRVTCSAPVCTWTAPA